MGRDKGMVRIGGMTMLERAVRVAGDVCGEVLVVGRERGPADWPGDLRAEFFGDGDVAVGGGEGRSGGPLLGLIRGLQIAQRPVLVLACDMPLISAETLWRLIAFHAIDAAATMAELAGGQIEPTVAVYTPALLPALEKMRAENRRSLQQVARLPGVKLWRVPAERAGEFLNVNDEAGLAEARRRIGDRAED